MNIFIIANLASGIRLILDRFGANDDDLKEFCRLVVENLEYIEVPKEVGE
jgi:hypothetical protein